MQLLGYALALLATTSQVAAIARVPHVRGSKAQENHHTFPKRFNGSPQPYVANKTRADAVRETFRISWDGYFKFAFPGDSLLPVTNGVENDRSGCAPSTPPFLFVNLLTPHQPAIAY